MSKTEQNSNQKLILEKRFQPNQFVNDFIKSIQRQFPNIRISGNIMTELLNEVYPQMRTDLNACEDENNYGKNPQVSLTKICPNGVLNKEEFDILVLDYIAKFNKEKDGKIKYECLKIDLENSQPNSQIVETDLQILEIEKMREKTTAEMLEELKNHNFGLIDKTQILAFLDFLENIVNFEIQFGKNQIKINPLGIDNLDLDDNVLSGFNQKEKDFYRLIADFIKAKNFEKQVLDKITELKESPEFSLAKRYSYETQHSQAQFLAPKINGIIKDPNLQKEFIKIINKNAKENNSEEFDINYLVSATSGYRQTEYLFTIHNNSFDIFDLNNLNLKNILINHKNFETFIKSLVEFIKLIEEKRKGFFAGHLKDQNWSEIGGVNLEGLTKLKGHLLDIEDLIKEIETIRIGRKGGDEVVDFDNLEMDSFLIKIKGLKIIESRIWDRDKFKKVFFEILHPIKDNLTLSETAENERFLGSIKEEKTSSETLIKVLHKFFWSKVK